MPDMDVPRAPRTLGNEGWNATHDQIQELVESAKVGLRSLSAEKEKAEIYRHKLEMRKYDKTEDIIGVLVSLTMLGTSVMEREDVNCDLRTVLLHDLQRTVDVAAEFLWNLCDTKLSMAPDEKKAREYFEDRLDEASTSGDYFGLVVKLLTSHNPWVPKAEEAKEGASAGEGSAQQAGTE